MEAPADMHRLAAHEALDAGKRIVDRVVEPAAVVEVRSIGQLIALADPRPWRWAMSRKAISLQIASVEGSLQQATERRLTFWRRVCGCIAGALFALAALAWCIYSHEHASASLLGAVLRGVAVVVAAGVLGKAAALVAARAAFIAEITFFIRRIGRDAQRQRG